MYRGQRLGRFAFRRDLFQLRAQDATASENRSLAIGTQRDFGGARGASEARAGDANADFRRFAGSGLRSLLQGLLGRTVEYLRFPPWLDNQRSSICSIQLTEFN